VNSPEAVASLDYYKSLMAYSPPDTLNYFWDDVMLLMQQGKVFQLLMWTDATYAVENPKQSKVAGKMAFDLTPQDKGGKIGQIEGWTYLIPTYSKNPEAAYLFIQWMMGFERQRTQHLNGGSSARPDIYADPAVKALSYSKASVDTFAVAKAQAHDPRVAAAHRDPGPRAQPGPDRQEDLEGRARYRGGGDEQAPRRVRAHEVSSELIARPTRAAWPTRSAGEHKP